MRYAQESFKGADGSTVRGAWVGSKWISEYHLREIATHAEEIISAGYGSDDSTPTKVKKVKTVKATPLQQPATGIDLASLMTMMQAQQAQSQAQQGQLNELMAMLK